MGRDMREIDIHFITDRPSEVLIGHHRSLIRLNPPRYDRYIHMILQLRRRVARSTRPSNASANRQNDVLAPD
eukprot:2081064-Prymnesium_polylepis.1